VYISVNGRFAGKFLVTDALKKEAKETVSNIFKTNAQQSILSGDHRDLVMQVARELRITEGNCHCELSPEQKLDLLENCREKKAMIGNGFNDSLVLAKADVGITVPGSHVAATNLSDIHIANGKITGVWRAIQFAKVARRRLFAISTFAILYNSCALFAACLGYVTPFAAAVLMPLSSLTVVILATRG
jgi:P-type E1-E2 ATPase